MIMKKIKIYDIAEYLCPTLVLSYLIYHNIYLVLIGITLSLYFINITYINSIIKSIITKLVEKNKSKDLNNKHKELETRSNSIKSLNEDSRLTLVQAIEELGFIPSIDSNNDSNAV